MARIDTLPTLPELGGSDESVDGWMFDTEPGLPPEMPSPLPQELNCDLPIRLEELVRAPRLIDPRASFGEVAIAIAGADGDPIVVAERGRPLGVVRPGDVVRAMVAGGGHEQLAATAMMSESVYCLRVDAPAGRALELIVQRGAREVAVIDPTGRVIGMVLPEDVTRALSRQGTSANIA